MTTTITVPAYVNSMGYQDWWCPCGITPADVVAAYAAKGAASYAASKVNLANPSTNDAIDGVAPDWDSINGWKFNGSTHFLSMGTVVFGTEFTVIFKFSDFFVSGYNSHSFFGYDNPGTPGEVIQFNMDISDGDSLYFNYPSGMSGFKAVNYSNGVLALNLLDIYKDGEPISANINNIADKIVTGIPYIGCVNIKDLDPYQFMQINYQAFAMYDKTLTQAQIQSIGSSMP